MHNTNDTGQYVLAESEKVTNEKPTPHACLLLCQLGKLCHPTQQQTAVEKVEVYQTHYYKNDYKSD